jgi:hypothetical protein
MNDVKEPKAMSERMKKRSRRTRIVGELRVPIAAVAARDEALLGMDEARRIRQRLAFLAKLLRRHGPFKIGRHLRFETGLLIVPVRDVSELQDATFVLVDFLALADRVDRKYRSGAAASSTSSTRDQGDKPRGTDAGESVPEDEGICDLVDAMKELGGVRLVDPNGVAMQIGPESPPPRAHTPNPAADMRMDVACRRDVFLVTTNKGPFIVRWDERLKRVKPGDAVEVMEEADGGLIHCARARAAVKAKSQLSLELLSLP